MWGLPLKICPLCLDPPLLHACMICVLERPGFLMLLFSLCFDTFPFADFSRGLWKKYLLELGIWHRGRLLWVWSPAPGKTKGASIFLWVCYLPHTYSSGAFSSHNPEHTALCTSALEQPALISLWSLLDKLYLNYVSWPNSFLQEGRNRRDGSVGTVIC